MKAGFKDIERELWLRMRDKGLIVWETKDGKEIPIKDMDDSHLVNCYNMRKRLEEENSYSINASALTL